MVGLFILTYRRGRVQVGGCQERQVPGELPGPLGAGACGALAEGKGPVMVRQGQQLAASGGAADGADVGQAAGRRPHERSSVRRLEGGQLYGYCGRSLRGV